MTIHPPGEALKMRHASLQNETPAPAGRWRGSRGPWSPGVDGPGSGGDSVVSIALAPVEVRRPGVDDQTQARLWPTRCKSSRAIAKSTFCNHMRPYDHGSDSFAIAGARKFNRRRQCLLAAARAADSIGADDDGGGRRRRAGTSERNRDVRDRRRRIARRRYPLVL